MIFCHQDDCEAIAHWRYTWPGQHEAAICEACFPALRDTAADLGIEIEAKRLTLEDHANPKNPLIVKVRTIETAPFIVKVPK